PASHQGLLEPDAGRLARPVLRRARRRKAPGLSDVTWLLVRHEGTCPQPPAPKSAEVSCSLPLGAPAVSAAGACVSRPPHSSGRSDEGMRSAKPAAGRPLSGRSWSVTPLGWPQSGDRHWTLAAGALRDGWRRGQSLQSLALFAV